MGLSDIFKKLENGNILCRKCEGFAEVNKEKVFFSSDC